MSSKTKPTATQKDAKPALVPKLRFPEFRDAGGWNYEEVGDLLDESRTPSSQNDPSRRITVRLHLQGVEHREHRGTESTESTNNFSRKAGQFIYGKQNIHKGAFGIIPSHLHGFETSQDLPCFDFRDRCFSQWLYYHFAREAVYSPLELRMTGTGSKRLNERSFLGLPIAAPAYAEQQKIASCLSSLDHLITAHAQKLNALKTHKKGLMQQLFPREGETVPRLRFPEFKNTGEWDYAPLGQLLVGRPDYGVNAAAVPFSEGLPKYLRITDISEDGTYLSDKMVSVDIEPTAGNYLDEGDIALARTGASVGKSYRYRKEDGRLVFAGFLIRIKPVTMKLVSAYLANYLTTDRYWDWVTATSARSGQPGINSTEYSSLSIPLPPGDLAEQQRIATCLTTLDDLIAAQTQKIEALKTHKKGLMQGLFPRSEK